MMANLEPTYVREGTEVLAFLDGEVLARGHDVESVEGEAKERLAARTAKADAERIEARKRTATHITTPNGIKGTVLARNEGIWGETVTVRMEHGETREFYTTGHEIWENAGTQKVASANPVENLRTRLAADYDPDKQSLRARLDDLRHIHREAGDHIIKGASYIDSAQLDQIRVLAEAEISEVSDVLEHLDSVDDSIAPPEPFLPSAAEQATVGVRDDGSQWLDVAVQDMIDENSSQNFEQVLDEGPAVLVAELEDAALADAGTVRELALSHITSKTAGIENDHVSKFRDLFLARVEEERRVQLARRKQEVRKEAAVDPEVNDDFPDEALFI
jgi:hypothetical protein